MFVVVSYGFFCWLVVGGILMGLVFVLFVIIGFEILFFIVVLWFVFVFVWIVGWFGVNEVFKLFLVLIVVFLLIVMLVFVGLGVFLSV